MASFRLDQSSLDRGELHVGNLCFRAGCFPHVSAQNGLKDVLLTVGFFQDEDPEIRMLCRCELEGIPLF